jgi:hypothetical protein
MGPAAIGNENENGTASTLSAVPLFVLLDSITGLFESENHWQPLTRMPILTNNRLI